MKSKKKACNKAPVVTLTPLLTTIDAVNLQALISAEQAAYYLDVTIRTLANWRSRGFPNVPFSKIGRCVRYRISDLDAYIVKNSHNSVED